MKLHRSVSTLTARYQPQLQAALRNLRSVLTQAQAETVPALQAIGQLLRTRRLPERVPIALKLAFAFVLLIATGMIVLGFLVGTNQTTLLEHQMDKYGSTLVLQTAETAREPLLANDSLNLELLTNNLTQDPNIKGAAVYTDEKKLAAKNGLVPDLNRHKAKPSPFTNTISIYSWEQQQKDGDRQSLISYLAPIMYRKLRVGYVLITFDYSVMTEATHETVTTVISTILLMLLLAIGISFYLGRRFTRPIQQLVEASKAFADGHYEYRLKDNRNDELGVLMESINFMGEGLLRKEQVEQVFSRYVSPQVAQHAIADLEHLELGGRHVNASVLFADIVGFTSMSEKLTPQEVSTLLNLYFSNIARAVHFCGGHIDKFMGDCAMIAFGVPEENEENRFYAIACGWMILELIRQMNQRRNTKGLTPIEFRIGVNSGVMLAGNMGSAERMEYTVVGDAVNLASRLSHVGDPGQAIVTEDMLAAEELVDRIVATHRGKIKLRGKKEAVSVFHIRDIHDPFRARMLEEIRRIMESSETEAA